jgi:endonuclease-3 related protein
VKKGNRYFIDRAFKLLYNTYGPQYWWPADSTFEVMVGAILTQNTNWTNVEKAISNLKAAGLLSPHTLYKLPIERLSEFIRPAGYYNIKAERLRAFLEYLHHRWCGDIERMKKEDTETLRKELLQVKGIGPETADSILLYAFNRPVFVVDAYTKRILQRHGIVGEDAKYSEIQDLFQSSLPRDPQLFNEYHALLVAVGKNHCKRKPLCSRCPLGSLLPEKLQNSVSTTGR